VKKSLVWQVAQGEISPWLGDFVRVPYISCALQYVAKAMFLVGCCCGGDVDKLPIVGFLDACLVAYTLSVNNVKVLPDSSYRVRY
jgi:hypothetical protein